jgi:hypothetical protein
LDGEVPTRGGCRAGPAYGKGFVKPEGFVQMLLAGLPR